MTRLCPGDKVRRTESSDERGQFALTYIDCVIPSDSILAEFSKPGHRTVTVDMWHGPYSRRGSPGRRQPARRPQ
jgi:hypothetical protein